MAQQLLDDIQTIEIQMKDPDRRNPLGERLDWNAYVKWRLAAKWALLHKQRYRRQLREWIKRKRQEDYERQHSGQSVLVEVARAAERLVDILATERLGPVPREATSDLETALATAREQDAIPLPPGKGD